MMSDWSYRPRVLLMAFISLLITLPVNHAYASEKQPLVMAMVQKESDYYGRLVSLIYREAFSRIGRDLEIRYYPIKRSDLMIETGRIDGDLARAQPFNGQYPHLVPVAESPLTLRIVVFSTSPTLKFSSWDALRQTGFRVNYLGGSALLNNRLARRTASGQITPVPEQENFAAVGNWTIGLRKLFAGRSDLFVAFDGVVRFAMTKSEFYDKQLFNAGVLEELALHAYLQPEHEDVAKALAVVLKEMKAEGVIRQFEQEAFTSGYVHRVPSRD